MNTLRFGRTTGHRPLRLALLLGVTLAAAPAVSQDASEDPPPPCSAPEFSQFDFWVGTWDLAWEGGTGTNVIDKPMDDCVIRETFDGGPFRGTSVSTYSPRLGLWQQTWVDNAGGYMDFTGGMEGDRMILSREGVNLQGDPVHQRMIFYDIQEDSMTWDWETSPDGEEWNLAWRIHYSRAAE